MKTIFYILLLLMICFSCTTINTFNHSKSVLNELNEKFDLETVTIIKTNQEVIKGYDINVSIDSTTWLDSAQNIVIVPTSEINEIIYKSAWDGANDGGTYGFLTGAGVGLIALLTTSESGGKDYASPALSAAIIGVGWGLGFG